MKTKKLYTITSILFCMMITQSCEKLLEVDAPSNQINATDVFENLSTADAALSNLYADIQASSLFSGGSWGAGAILGVYTDELNCYSTSVQNSDFDMYQNVQIPTNLKIKAIWTTAYQEIYMANAIIEGVDKSDALAEKDKKRIKGEAIFIRSLIYFYLSQIFGDIPYTTVTNYTINQSLKKTSEKDVLTKVQNDMLTAVNLLDDNYRNAERKFVNKKTAELLLATILMTQNQWLEAEKLLRNIIGSSLYTWQTDLTKTFKISGKHIIWQLKPLKQGNSTNEAQLYYFVNTVPNNYSLSDNLVSSFEDNDLRKQTWIKTISINQRPYYRVDKYRNTVNNTDEYSIVYRLEEAYLLLAETLVQQNKLSESIPYINAVKQKAGIGLLPNNANKEQLINEILIENKKEFFSERGIRFFSLKRAGRLNDLKLSKPNWKNYHNVWPLPFSELIINPNLNPQNNGY